MPGSVAGRTGLCRALTDVYLSLMLCVYLLFPGWKGYTSITGDCFFLFSALTGGYVLAVVLLGKLSPTAFLRQANVPQKLVLLYLLWSGVSTVCSISPALSFQGSERREGFVTIALYCLAFLLVSAFLQPSGRHLWLFGISISLCCILALIQLAGYNPLLLYPRGLTYQDGHVRYAGQFLGTIGNVDLLAAVLCVAIPIFWVGLLRLTGRKRVLLALPLGLALSVLCLSRVQAGLVGVLGGALLTLPAIAPRRRKELFFGVLGLAAVCLAFIFCFGDQLGGLFYEAHELLRGRWQDSFGSGRLYIWRSVLPLVGERPLLGGGLETLALRREILFQRWDNTFGLIQSVADTAHNEYLHILVCQGLPALAFYLGALIAAAAGWGKAAPTDPVCAMCGAGALGYCIQAFFGISSVISAPFFWLALAVLVGRCRPALRA